MTPQPGSRLDRIAPRCSARRSSSATKINPCCFDRLHCSRTCKAMRPIGDEDEIACAPADVPDAGLPVRAFLLEARPILARASCCSLAGNDVMNTRILRGGTKIDSASMPSSCGELLRDKAARPLRFDCTSASGTRSRQMDWSASDGARHDRRQKQPRYRSDWTGRGAACRQGPCPAREPHQRRAGFRFQKGAGEVR